MPQILGFVLIGAGLIAGYKALRRVAERMSAGIDRAAGEARRQAAAAPTERVAKDLGQLELDPGSGEYRPRKG